MSKIDTKHTVKSVDVWRVTCSHCFDSTPTLELKWNNVQGLCSEFSHIWGCYIGLCLTAEDQTKVKKPLIPAGSDAVASLDACGQDCNLHIKEIKKKKFTSSILLHFKMWCFCLSIWQSTRYLQVLDCWLDKTRNFNKLWTGIVRYFLTCRKNPID